MAVFRTLLINDIKLILRDWKACIVLLAVPFLFIAFFAYALSPYLGKSSFIEPFPVALVDRENTVQTRMLARQLEGVGIFSEVVRTDEPEAKKMLSDGKVASIIIIPKGLTDSVSVGENTPVTVIGSSSKPLQSLVVKNLVKSAASLVSSAQSAIITIYHYNQEAGLKGKALEEQFNASTMKFFVGALSRNEIFSQADTAPQYNLTPVEYFTAALIVIFLMFAGMPGMKMLVTERSTGVTKRLMASPARVWQIILSKLLVSVLLSAIQFGVIIALTSIVFRSYWGAPVKSILLMFAGVIFAVSAWSVFVSAISTSPASADVIGNLGILLMAILGGSIYPLSSMPEFVKAVSRLTITRWGMDGFMVVFSGNDALSVSGYVYPLLAIGLVFFGLAAGVMKLARR